MTTENKPHVHRTAIIAFANGSTIECMNPHHGNWHTTTEPSFNVDYQYRVLVVDLVLEGMKEKLVQLYADKEKLEDDIDTLIEQVKDYVPSDPDDTPSELNKSDSLIKSLRRTSIRKACKVHGLLAENDEIKIDEACKLHGVSPATYYLYKRGLELNMFPKGESCE
ncbi:hypothetical protein COPG_00122 [Colwellia phage 9A]|uniref:Uncharacterized protein n=1 Tax=Colwellia phage 9A TaxID=765765 RepID=I3UMK3_9CAUD|nr:hypothetical protein COPG_00122 [Colwellia phage 9A]AFK66718.1 hypothetical protein COPG_00122 [Colwellia phage 9A]